MSYLEIERTFLKRGGHLKILFKIGNSFAAKGTNDSCGLFFVFPYIFDPRDGNEQ